MAYKISTRKQMKMFPPLIDDYVSKEDAVRVYDAFVDALDFKELGISIELGKRGAQEYYPKDMLKLIIYGYSYGTRSSRKLERACHHNLSFIWLMGDLKPDYRTIARFRSEHSGAIKKVLKQCVHMCVKLDIIEGNAIFIDGSPFRANASIRRTWTEERCEKHLKELSHQINELVDESVKLDREEEDKDSIVKVKKEVMDKIERRDKIQKIKETLDEKGPKSQHNETDSDAVKIQGRQGKHAGYNAQIVTDAKHGLIVHAETLSHNQDYNKFNDQLNKATAVLEKKPKYASSDCGYYSPKDIDKVDKEITVVMPSIKQAQKEKKLHPINPFHKEQFTYDTEKDEYICPRDKRLKHDNGCKPIPKRIIYKTERGVCQVCPDLNRCTKSSEHRRYIHTNDKEALKRRLRSIYLSPQGQALYKLRKEKVELPFGHMKRNLGALQFMLRGRAKVNAEFSILSTCFNIARMISLIGTPTLLMKLKVG